MESGIKPKYKLIGKPLHPNKHQVLFELFDAYFVNSSENETEDWIITKEENSVLTVMNKHTFEEFTFIILL